MAAALGGHQCVVSLPLEGVYREVWDSLGVTWEHFEGSPFTAKAYLQAGWSVREKAISDINHRDFIVFDDRGVPKADVKMNTAVGSMSALVNLVFDAAQKAALAPKVGQSEFDLLISNYNRVARSLHGTGKMGQDVIDLEYENLEAFVEANPQFQPDMPHKFECFDDGSGGIYVIMNKLAGLS